MGENASIETDLKERECENVDKIHLDPEVGRCERGDQHSCSIKAGNFLTSSQEGLRRVSTFLFR
jgi:hypothetical protein